MPLDNSETTGRVVPSGRRGYLLLEVPMVVTGSPELYFRDGQFSTFCILRSQGNAPTSPSSLSIHTLRILESELQPTSRTR